MPLTAHAYMAIARIYSLSIEAARRDDPAFRYTKLAVEGVREGLRRSPELGRNQPLQPDFAALREHREVRAAVRRANSATPATNW
jgi:hypothetical protein